MGDEKSALLHSFGRVLRQARTGCGISQEKLALECDLDRTFISLLERGLRQPSLTTLIALSGALNTEADEMVRETIAGAKRR